MVGKNDAPSCVVSERDVSLCEEACFSVNHFIGRVLEEN